VKLAEATIGTVLFWGPNEDGSQALIISGDPHECGWPERDHLRQPDERRDCPFGLCWL
jgi:hypothetical protein